MGEYLDQIPEQIREHIRQITSTSGLEPGEASVELIAQSWLEKKSLFETRVAENQLEAVDAFGADEDRGALAMTYSGSLLTIGPRVDGVRHVEYSSIGLRDDVPESATHDRGVLSDELAVDSIAEFSAGPIKKSSPIFMIAVASEQLDAEEEEDLLINVTQVLAEDFVEVNKTIIRGE